MRTPADLPRVLCDAFAVASEVSGDQAGAVWRLAESGRQLDANLVRLPPGEQVALHVEPDLDVLLLVVTGTGVLASDEGERHVNAGALVWLPRGARRGVAAGADGLVYLTVHRRRPGMRIRSTRPGSAGPA